MVDSFLVNIRFGIEVGGGEAPRFTFVQPNKARASPLLPCFALTRIIAGADLEYNCLLSHKMHFYGDVLTVFGIYYHRNLTPVGRK